jgi:hydrogenase nickel incorporation protein HypA/HybF
MRFSFEVCARGTPLEDAELQIVEIAAIGRCRTCGLELAVPSFGTPCTCGSFDRELVRGDEVRLAEVEVL